MLYKYLETNEEIAISGISTNDNQVDKVLEILKIDAVILLSCNRDFISNCLRRLGCLNILVILPGKIQIKTDNIKPCQRIEMLTFNQTKNCLTEKLNSLFNRNFKTNDGGGKNFNSLISKREKEILLLILKGKKTREIAEELFLSVKTVENHRNNILKKTKAKSMLALVNELMRIGYLK